MFLWQWPLEIGRDRGRWVGASNGCKQHGHVWAFDVVFFPVGCLEMARGAALFVLTDSLLQRVVLPLVLLAGMYE